ncbi:hypothetical protein K437DRAFT_97635 [Tilletiaria anomala UBC 951]|uniref:Uncharacterized protein n=1 Tax=Tilletiaria anomala (strain ATCC 24038 / CBS 436.72 / UBC 951) TaxID=1037660 RepID=A0A066WL43_TILAU|nr:uncharacterized protein K437DRAFT_97635 [Tilletiaria anomala UBC 951]KDN53298.1 hypothetical protein K437DRAFT_97635 [Tilletiaria anomala UBC 951]
MPATVLSSKVSGLKFMQRAAARSAIKKGTTPSSHDAIPVQPPAPAPEKAQASTKTGDDSEEWSLTVAPGKHSNENELSTGIVYDADWRSWVGDGRPSMGLRKRYKDGEDEEEAELKRRRKGESEAETAPKRDKGSSKMERGRYTQGPKGGQRGNDTRLAFKKPAKS